MKAIPDLFLGGHWIKSQDKVQSLSYLRWMNLVKRCTPGSCEQLKHPSYCGTRNNFECFDSFVNWSRSEVGYIQKELNGNLWSLDKDILGGKSKVYSPETCLFVPAKVNTFVTGRISEQGPYPTGVTLRNKDGIFRARIGIEGKRIHLGYFVCSMEAHKVWQKHKIIQGREIASQYKDTHTKLYDGLNAWVDVIQEDLTYSREST